LMLVPESWEIKTVEHEIGLIGLDLRHRYSVAQSAYPPLGATPASLAVSSIEDVNVGP
jgi:hypothetical protein